MRSRRPGRRRRPHRRGRRGRSRRRRCPAPRCSRRRSPGRCRRRRPRGPRGRWWRRSRCSHRHNAKDIAEIRILIVGENARWTYGEHGVFVRVHQIVCRHGIAIDNGHRSIRPHCDKAASEIIDDLTKAGIIAENNRMHSFRCLRADGQLKLQNFRTTSGKSLTKGNSQ